jgi:hypothetical protein
MGKYGLVPRKNWFEDWIEGWPFGEPQSWTYRGMWVDLDKYDVTLKEAHKEKLAKEKDKELEELEKYYEKKKQKLLAEKKELTS